VTDECVSGCSSTERIRISVRRRWLKTRWAGKDRFLAQATDPYLGVTERSRNQTCDGAGDGENAGREGEVKFQECVRRSCLVLEQLSSAATPPFEERRSSHRIDHRGEWLKRVIGRWRAGIRRRWHARAAEQEEEGRFLHVHLKRAEVEMEVDWWMWMWMWMSTFGA